MKAQPDATAIGEERKEVRVRDRTATVNILFHGLGIPGPGIEAGAERYFVSTGVFLAVLDEIRENPKVKLSFDDGYASDIEIALPALVERGLTACFFPLAGQLGRGGYLDAEGVRELATSGMEVGSHGMRHRSWRGLDPSVRHEELVDARHRLSVAAGIPIDIAACPFGTYDRGTLAALRDLGYRRVFTSDRRRAHADAWLQPRYSVRRGDTVETVRANILAARPLPERARGALVARAKAWR